MSKILPSVFNDDLSDDFQKALDIADSLGLKFVKLRNINGHPIGDVTEQEIKDMKSALEDSPVKIGCVGTPVIGKGCLLTDEKMYQEQLKVFKTCIRLCKEFDADSMRVFAFTKPDDIGYYCLDDNLDDIVAKLREPVRIAEEEGVTLLFETEWKTHVGTAEEAAKLLDALDSERVKVCWDVMNAWYSGERTYPDGYKHIKGRIGHVHLKDMKMDLQMNQVIGTRVPVGRGDIPYIQIFKTLLQDGYEGFATIERKFAPGTAEKDPVLMGIITADVQGLNEILRIAESG